MLADQIQKDLQQAQLDKDEVKVSTLRMLISEMRYAVIQKREGDHGELSDAETQTVIQKEIKKRKDAAAGFRQGNREDSALKEETEANILQAYLPAQLADEELTKLVEEAINEVGANSMADMGKVIGLVMGKAAGKVDGGRVSSMIKEKLGNI